jgi:hypothetical protein
MEVDKEMILILMEDGMVVDVKSCDYDCQNWFHSQEHP